MLRKTLIYTNLFTFSLTALGWEPLAANAKVQYREAIARTAQMTHDASTQQRVRKLGLSLGNITWEDTGRYKGSSVGPNISDMTIQVGVPRKNGKGFDLTLMPVIRYDNFTDRTADVDPGQFTLLVGNHKDEKLLRVSLRDFLEEPTRYLSKPTSWKDKPKSLLAKRDTQVLVSAQAAFLPVPKEGKAVFNPVLFNYQSVADDPAVLTLLVTRQGTSVTVIDNQRDGLSNSPGWGQRLFHNQNGQRTSLTGERLSDFRKSAGPSEEVPSDDKKSSGLNMVLLIQVPLKQKNPPRFGKGVSTMMSAPSSESVVMKDRRRGDASDVEAAVIGHGDFEGPFTEIDGNAPERDERFPIRVTVQFYKATATGNASDADLAQIKEEIDGVLSNGDAVGSLVVNGETGRPTEYEGMKEQPADWWQRFFERHERNTGEKPAAAVERLQKLLGHGWKTHRVCGLYLDDQLRRKRH